MVGEEIDDNEQFIFQSFAKKSLTCLDVSTDGKYITTGEVWVFSVKFPHI